MMRYMNNMWIKIAVLLGIVTGLGSCTDDDYPSLGAVAGYSLELKLPQDNVVELGTRSVNESAVSDLLAVIIRDGIAQCEYVETFNPTEGGSIIATLEYLDPKKDETLYVFCNTGRKTVAATDALSLFKAFTFDNTASTKNIMSGSQSIGEIRSLSIELSHAMAKASVASTASGYKVKGWKICNVPSSSNLSNSTYPDDATFDEIVEGDATTGIAYFIPRMDNSDNRSGASELKTCVLVNLTEEVDGSDVDRYWYRLDFYNKGVLDDIDAKIELMDILPNNFYKFDIKKVTGNGYLTEEEAQSNPGSNIVYNMEIADNRYASSNGQYMLRTNKNEIALSPIGADAGGNTERSMEAITLFADIPQHSGANISTFTVDLVNPSGQIHIDGGLDEHGVVKKVTSLSLLEKPLTSSASYVIKLIFDGANVQDSYLTIKLGNITREVPITIETSNCYLFNFKDNSVDDPSTLYIPVAQANKEGTRITDAMVLTPEIIWSDQNNLNLEISYEQVKQWIEVSSRSSFAGNVVVGLLDDAGVVKWSWHIWSLGNDVIHYDNSLGLYDFNTANTNEYNSNTWMDRNLGAYDMTKGKAAAIGLLYQWGRKDPFPGSADGTTNEDQQKEPTIYCGSDSSPYQMTGKYPKDNSDCAVSVNPGNGNNLIYSIEHPWQFIKTLEDDFEGDWLTSSTTEKRNDAWLKDDLSKGTYNPCPNGWTLPYGGKFGPWVGLLPLGTEKVLADGGYRYSDAGFYPYSPARLTTNDNVMYLNQSAYITTLWWGNYEDDKSMTQFATNGFFPRIECQKSWGNPVRCVKIKKEL